MLLLHHTGRTHISDVRRYTITYTPHHDRILPLPTHLHLRIKNTASLPLRAAYLHGPYTLYVSVRRAEFSPWGHDRGGEGECGEGGEGERVELGEEEAPVYEPHLKAGSSFYAVLKVPERAREDAMKEFHADRTKRGGYEMPLHVRETDREGEVARPRKHKSVTWIVEIISQVIFSTSATVGYEILLGRDEKSLSFGYPLGEGQRGEGSGCGVLSASITAKLEETRELWNSPPFPRWDDMDEEDTREGRERRTRQRGKRKPKHVHLVILTHGLHSNTGADMLFLKESIDAEARHAASIRKARREADLATGRRTREEVEKEAQEEEIVLVRGYEDNHCNTERGIKFLGKRLAKWIMHTAQPHLHSVPSSASHNKLQKRPPNSRNQSTISSHHHLLAASHLHHKDNPAWETTGISFIGHSLGGLVQVYAIAYIHAHSPSFFTTVTPRNFITLASPLLGLSNENPLYVKFALDFGLVGKTGQDLGLTWKARDLASPLVGAMGGGSSGGGGQGDKDKGGVASKPLLRILPTGPAHEVLKRFGKRTVYANVVNDGIVPLRTSCLLFLDWRGLGRVEKARRENGGVGGLVEWGIGQLVEGKKVRGKSEEEGEGGKKEGKFTSPWSSTFWSGGGKSGESTPTPTQSIAPSQKPSVDLDSADITDALPSSTSTQQTPAPSGTTSPVDPKSAIPIPAPTPPAKSKPNPFASLMTLLRPHASKPPPPTSSTGTSPTSTSSSSHHHHHHHHHHLHHPSRKNSKIYHRSQTNSGTTTPTLTDATYRGPAFPMPKDAEDIVGKVGDDDSVLSMSPPEPPPTTSIFEAAGDLLNPPLPDLTFIMDPASRPKTIHHERVYKASDIPPLNASVGKSAASGSSGKSGKKREVPVEEKIARAYHKDMDWRKVLVRLEPDAHNNINVRRMFANAYGWPVVEHLVRTHFGVDAELGERTAEDVEVVEGHGTAMPSAEEDEAVEEGEEGRATVGLGLGLPPVLRKSSPPISPTSAQPSVANSPPLSALTVDSIEGSWNASAWAVTDDEDSHSSSSSSSDDDDEPTPPALTPLERLTSAFSALSPSASILPPTPAAMERERSTGGMSTASYPDPGGMSDVNTRRSSYESSTPGGRTAAKRKSRRRKSGEASVGRPDPAIVAVGLRAMSGGGGVGSGGIGGGNGGDAVRLLERCYDGGRRGGGEVRRVGGWVGGSRPGTVEGEGSLGTGGGIGRVDGAGDGGLVRGKSPKGKEELGEGRESREDVRG